MSQRPHRRFRRPMIVGASAVLVVIAALATVRVAVAEVFYVPTDVVAPEVPRGARVLVFKRAATWEPGQIVAYRVPDGVWLARVAAVDAAAGTLRLVSNAGEYEVDRRDVIGRVVLTTR